MAESIITPDPEGSSNPIPKNVDSQRNRRNLQQTFDLSSIKSFSENYPRFFIVDFEGISSRQINPHNLIEAIRDHTGEQPVSVTNIGNTSLTVECKSPAQSGKIQSMIKVSLAKRAYTLDLTHLEV